jgi:hypothetical protein
VGVLDVVGALLDLLNAMLVVAGGGTQEANAWELERRSHEKKNDKD